MRYLLDTNTCIGVLTNRVPTLVERWKRVRPSQVRLCSVVKGELLFGAPYAGGNVLDLPLETIWEESPEVRFSRDRDASELWGFCKLCYYADLCRAGCSWTAHVTLGRRGNNPFCYHRVVQLRKKGVRETLVQRERAPNEPYDYGRFEIVEEPWPIEELARS